MDTRLSSKAKWLFGVIALAVLLTALWRLDSSVGNLAERVEVLQAEVEALDNTGRTGLQPRHGAPRAVARADLRGAVDALEMRLTALEGLAAVRVADCANGKSEPAVPEDAAGRIPAVDEAPEVVARHAREHGASAWGRQTAGQLEWHYADADFFGRHGGDLALDCRQSICRVLWEAPDMADLPPEESDRIAAMAKYELLAVIAAGAPGIGPILGADSESGAAGPASIELYFEQQEGHSNDRHDRRRYR